MDPVTALALGRVAAGALALARPDALTSLLGLGAPGGSGREVVTRLFGVREVALGALTLAVGAAVGPGAATARRSVVRAGVLVDLGDAAVAVGGHRAGQIGTSGTAVLAAVALTAAAIGAASASGD